MTGSVSRVRAAAAVAAAALAGAVAAGACHHDDPTTFRVLPQVLLTPSALALTAGGSAGINVDFPGGLPSETWVRWTSSAPSVAAVDTATRLVTSAGVAGAVVDARAPGTAVVTVTLTQRGRTVTDSVLVTVVNRAPCLTIGPSITPAALELAPGSRGQLRLRAAPCSTPDDTLASWVSLDTLVARVDSTGLVTGQRVGQTVVRAHLRRAPYLVAVATVTVRAAP